MNHETDVRERRTAWAMLIVCPVSMLIILAYVTAGHAPGLDAGHPMEYLQMTCILWAVITMFLPILRLLRLVALPFWFMLLLYGDMYFYVLSLSQGMYLNISWWGDFTHIIASMIVSSIVFIALCLVQTHSPSHVTLGSRSGMIAMLLLLGASFGGIWEIMEGYTDILSGKAYMSYGARDTLGDLTADLVGVLLTSLIAWRILGKQGTSNIAATVRIGKKAFEITE